MNTCPRCRSFDTEGNVSHPPLEMVGEFGELWWRCTDCKGSYGRVEVQTTWTPFRLACRDCCKEGMGYWEHPVCLWCDSSRTYSVLKVMR